VENTLPSRTMVCECERGFFGNPEIECKLRKFIFQKLVKLCFQSLSFFSACKFYFVNIFVVFVLIFTSLNFLSLKLSREIFKPS
jgi:hypothetical protein